MRGRAFHPAGFVTSYLRASYLTDEHPRFERCCNRLLKHVLPTLLIIICSSVIALYLGGLIDQAKQAHRTEIANNIVESGVAAKFP